MKKVNAFIKAQGFEYTHEYNGLEDTSLWYDADTKTQLPPKTAVAFWNVFTAENLSLISLPARWKNFC